MSSMHISQRQSGSVVLVASLVITVILLIGAAVFGFWAYGQSQDYKNNVDQKIAVAVADADKQITAQKEKEFAEKAKSPLKTYVGPTAYGSITLQYPKTWSGYVETPADGTPYVDGYFQPGVVPQADDESSTFALRIRVSGESYSSIMQNYASNAQSGAVQVTPYRLPKMPHIVGSKVVGQLDNQKNGTLIVIPLRAYALEIWTESNAHLNDFNKYILPNISFSP